MRLLHYSALPLVIDLERTYPESAYGFKPTGLWLSVEGDDDWRTWCEGERFGVERLKHASEVTLKPDANVLLIDSVPKLEKFNATFRRTDDPYDLRNIKWETVKTLYDGLLIAPYQWEGRHEFMWYYGWDCASGVIWNLSAIESVTQFAASHGKEP